MAKKTNATKVLNGYKDILEVAFDGQTASVDNDKLEFMNYRLVLNTELGTLKFQDIPNGYKTVRELIGLPTKDELVQFFKDATQPMSAKEVAKKVKGDKPAKADKKAKEEKADEKTETQVSEETKAEKSDPLSEARTLLQKALTKGGKLRTSEIIAKLPAKQRKVAEVIETSFKNKEIDSKKLLSEFKKLVGLKEKTNGEKTEKVKKEKAKLTKFDGTILPEFKCIGALTDDKLEVDGKKINAVPFLRDWLLYYEPDAMYRLQAYMEEKIDKWDLLGRPEAKPTEDIKYDPHKWTNSIEHAEILKVVMCQWHLEPPMNQLFNEELGSQPLAVGDKIKLWQNDAWHVRTITSVENGIEINGGEALLKIAIFIRCEAEAETETSTNSETK